MCPHLLLACRLRFTEYAAELKNVVPPKEAAAGVQIKQHGFRHGRLRHLVYVCNWTSARAAWLGRWAREERLKHYVNHSSALLAAASAAAADSAADEPPTCAGSLDV